MGRSSLSVMIFFSGASRVLSLRFWLTVGTFISFSALEAGKLGKREREPGIDVTGAPNRDGGVLVRSPVDRVTVSLCV